LSKSSRVVDKGQKLFKFNVNDKALVEMRVRMEINSTTFITQCEFMMPVKGST